MTLVWMRNGKLGQPPVQGYKTVKKDVLKVAYAAFLLTKVLNIW
jgi:hypothetical protein